jgi:hypothetical protein
MRALSCLGERKYGMCRPYSVSCLFQNDSSRFFRILLTSLADLLFRNCEHFATWAFSGQEGRSEQVESTVLGMAATVVVAMGAQHLLKSSSTMAAARMVPTVMASAAASAPSATAFSPVSSIGLRAAAGATAPGWVSAAGALAVGAGALYLASQYQTQPSPPDFGHVVVIEPMRAAQTEVSVEATRPSGAVSRIFSSSAAAAPEAGRGDFEPVVVIEPGQLHLNPLRSQP